MKTIDGLMAELAERDEQLEKLANALGKAQEENFRLGEELAKALDQLESMEEYAHQRDLDHIGQRNELELLRADNLQRRAEDVYYGRNRRDRY